ncbi:hypothetical protein QBC40DRAFT_273184 [Triangularia verruculosa]|uniref:Uncharacterized protein n=1 Tax=Triangularia verruculosa TaxID=2587418 RepID=A0AAN6XPS1_9PEZI|nr:hypothetical protein QBC40DRAFT_273184 [Triangularia verruculosa]
MAGPGRPGRPRRSESVDHDPVHYLKEGAVLKPTEPGVEYDKWPCFVLLDATIYRKDGKTIANPLMVHAEGPLVIHGLLEIDSDTKEHLRNPGARRVYMEVTDSTKYSFSDGPFALWMAGSSRWFEIKPSKKYLPMYREIQEAANLYFPMLDVHKDRHELVKRAKKSGKKQPAPLTMDQIFLKCAVNAGNGIVRHEVEAWCDKWAEFLLSHSRKEDQSLWKSTPLTQWLSTKHPELEKRVDDAAKGLAISVPPPPQLEDSEDDAPRPRRKNQATRDSQDVEMTDITSSRSQKLPSRPLSQPQSRPVESPVPLPEKYLNLGKPASAVPRAPVQPSTFTSQPVPDSPVDRFLSILDEAAELLPDLATASPSKVCNKVYFLAKVKDYHGAREICCYYSRDMVSRLDPKIWHGTPFYNWLVDMSQNWNGVLEYVKEEDIPAQVYRRSRSGPRAPRVIEQPSTPSTSSNHNRVTGNLRHSRHSGKRSTLRPGPSSKKRPASDMFDGEDDYDSSRGGKRSFNQSFDDEDMGNDDDDDDEDTDESSAAEVDPNLATPSDPASLLPLPAGVSRMVIQAERLPTLSPSGPNGTWTCPHDECGYVVRSADEPAAQELVEEHFRAHESNTQKIDLALMEGRKGHLPIDNLLQKIRQKGEQSLREKRGKLSDPSLKENNRLLRDRIKTRLLV